MNKTYQRAIINGVNSLQQLAWSTVRLIYEIVKPDPALKSKGMNSVVFLVLVACRGEERAMKSLDD